MLKHDLLKQWFKEIIRGDRIETFIEEGDKSGTGHGGGKWDITERYHLYTDRYKYSISAKDRSKDDGYLGCVVSARKPRAGEDWTRGNDLPDGPFTRKTWEKIKNAIIKYELVELVDKIDYQPDEESDVNFCTECGTALGVEEDLTITYQQRIKERIWKDCKYCEGRGYLEEIVGYTTGGEQKLSYTCPNCVGAGKEPTDMVIYG
jgi:hypothetical protein